MLLYDIIQLTPEQYELAKARFIAVDDEIKALNKLWPDYLKTPEDVRHHICGLQVEIEAIGWLFCSRREESWIFQSERGEKLQLKSHAAIE